MNAEACCGGGGADGTFDIAVIGAGSAGFSAAITAAEAGARVALIGHGTIGGTCVNIGCVPSKTLIRAVETLHQAAAAPRFDGIRASATLESWSALVRQKNALVEGLRQAKYVDVLPAYNTIAYMEGAARLVPGGVAVGGRIVAAPKIIIATGAAPVPPPIEGIDEVPYLTSTAALDLMELPRSLLVIGAGYVGCELAQMFARAGVEVTLLCRSRPLPDAEPEISAGLVDCFRDEGLVVRAGVRYRSVRRSAEGVILTLAGEGGDEEVAAERLLVAAGRRPNTEGLGLEEAGVEVAGNGGIRVDAAMRTTNPAVYAAGDVTGRDMFVYMAAYGAKIAARNALDGDAARYDSAAMPRVAFTDPQAAGVGLTEAEARAQGTSVKTSILPLEHVPRALAARDTRGLVKLVADAETDRLLGAHVLAPEGGDSIQTAALAIRHGMTTREMGETIFPYLTTVEGLKLAAQAFEKDVARLSCCAG